MEKVHLIKSVGLSLGTEPLVFFQELKMRMRCDDSELVKCALMLLHEVAAQYSVQPGWRVMARNKFFVESFECIDPVYAFKNRDQSEVNEPMMPDEIKIVLDQQAGLCFYDLVPMFDGDMDFTLQYALSLLFHMNFKYSAADGWNLQAEHSSGEIEQIESYREIFA